MIINKENLDKFKEDVEKALREVERKYGVTISCAGATYETNKFSLPLKVKNVAESGLDVETQEAINFLPWFANIFGKTFKDGRHTYKVVGYEKYTKYPIKCVRDDGKDFSYTEQIAKSPNTEWR